MKRKTTVMANISRYRGNPARAFTGVLILALLTGCFNLLDLPETDYTPNAPAGSVLVRIVIGGEGAVNARTIQPAAAALAGYRFTFSSGHDPVNITSGNNASVYLPDGTYTITATAYKAGGTIGNVADVVSSGSISVTLSNGVVTGGAVPPIILVPVGTAAGTLTYTITSSDAASGTMKLWNINGTDPVSDFGTSGELTLGTSPSLSNQTVSLPTGRYIAEIRLEDSAGKIALLREVVEIWGGLNTALSFAPAASDYLDPAAGLAYSGAKLSADSTIGISAIGTGGSESGLDEANAITYSVGVLDITNAPVVLESDDDSLFAAISWTATAGSAPGGTGYGATTISDFSTTNVLWVKVVSEDGSTIRYYKFTLAVLDSDLTISGDGPYVYAGDTLRITGDGTYTIGMKTGVTTTSKNRIEVASGVTADITLNTVSINTDPSNNPNIDIIAFDMTGATVALTLTGSNILKGGLQGGYLTISANSTGALEARGGYVRAGIGGETITINGGTVTATGGYRGAGIGEGTVTITGGTVTATGGQSGAGIGGGFNGDGGTITITGGTVTVIGGDPSIAQGGTKYWPAGIGGGESGNGGTVIVSGGTVTARGNGGWGIGRGADGTNHGTIELSGNAVVFASSIGPTLTESNATQAIAFKSTAGTMYGNVTLQNDLTIPDTYTLNLASGQTLTVPGTVTLTNEGTINKNGGTITGSVDGTGTVNN